MENHRDVVIIGAGSAGLTAGTRYGGELTLCPNGMDVSDVDNGRPAAVEFTDGSVPGAWASGNVINRRAQVSTAASEASAAAIAMTAWLLEDDIATAVGQADTRTRGADR